MNIPTAIVATFLLNRSYHASGCETSIGGGNGREPRLSALSRLQAVGRGG